MIQNKCLTMNHILQNVIMLGAVGAYGWSGTVIHQNRQKSHIFPKKAFEDVLKDRNHSSLLGEEK